MVETQLCKLRGAFQFYKIATFCNLDYTACSLCIITRLAHHEVRELSVTRLALLLIVYAQPRGCDTAAADCIVPACGIVIPRTYMMSTFNYCRDFLVCFAFFFLFSRYSILFFFCPLPIRGAAVCCVLNCVLLFVFLYRSLSSCPT